jgi:hypothetical protein
MTERERPDGEASELEGGGTEQTWGQGEGRHEPTIPDDDDYTDTPATYSDGTPSRPTDPGAPRTREDEGMDR